MTYVFVFSSEIAIIASSLKDFYDSSDDSEIMASFSIIFSFSSSTSITF